MKVLKRVKIAYSIVSLTLLLYGFFLVVYPQLGIQWIYKIGGVLFIGIGILMLMWTKDMIRILTVLLGIFMLIEALLKIQTAIDVRQIGFKKWWLILVIGISTAVIGGLLIAAPIRGTNLIIRLIGLTILTYGLMNLYVVQNTVNTFRREYKMESYDK